MFQVKKSLTDELFAMVANNVFEPYIRHIRFPKFKNLEPNSRIDFAFPLTVLVGGNGTNKTSVLRALQGSPGMNNIGKYWFSTKLDPITEDRENPHCFIHGYQLPKGHIIVESLKTRINKQGEPDYWEPSRPVKRYGMETNIPEKDIYTDFHSKTRWNPIKKEVLYIDFRENLCAYDKYFYFGEFKKTQTLKTKQDRIRQWSTHLKVIAEQNLSVRKVPSGRKGTVNKLAQNVLLPKECIEIISDILGKKYDSVRMIRHRFFDSKLGTTVFFGNLDLNEGYSEAFAGSGESAIAMMVASLYYATPQTLILLDEPETSLHPGAQLKLRDYLLKQIKEKHHQIILATHSPVFAQEMPPEAIKVLHHDEAGKIIIRNGALPQEAFSTLGFPEQSKITVYVEDMLAQSILRYVLEHLKPDLQNSFDVTALPGGAEYIMQKSLVANAISNRQNVFYLLDGDKSPSETFPEPCEIAEADYEEKIHNYLHIKADNLGLPIDQHGPAREKQKHDFIRKIFDYIHKKHLQYLPFKTPERFLLTNTVPSISLEVNDVNGKETLSQIAMQKYNKKNIQSIEIDCYAQMLLGQIRLDCVEFTKIGLILESMAEIALSKEV